MTQTALVVGTSGIVGSAAAERLVQEGWAVHGLARRPLAQPGVAPTAADLQDAAGLRAALEGAAPGGVRPELVIVSTWSRQASEAENIRVNAAMVRNLLDAVRYAPAEQAVWINKTRNFAPVPQAVWDFHIAGYQVLDKYLKSRKGRVLSLDEITHLAKVAGSLAFTIDQMAPIDATYLKAFPQLKPH